MSSSFGDLDVRLEPWDVEYGSEMPLEATEEAFKPDVGLDTEVPEDRWEPLTPPAAAGFKNLFFVDGVRRVEARLIIRRESKVCRGAFGSYAVGSVRISDGRAEIDETQSTRMVVLGSGEAISDPVEVMPNFTYFPASIESSDTDGPLHFIQNAMRLGEERLARGLAGQADRLVVLDGPLTFGEPMRGQAVGYIKRLHRLYIDQGSHARGSLDLLSRLPAGSRTPLFAIPSSKRFARYSWFLRLATPHPGESLMSGIVRLEVSEAVGVDGAKRLADATAQTLPRFAPGRGRDPRSPQNLLPVGALEARLRRQLGDRRLIRRHIGALLAREASTLDNNL